MAKATGKGGAALAFSHVSFSYGEQRVLDDVSFEIPEGEYVAVIGPNGAGKTTLIKLALGLLSPDTGAIEVLGTPRERFSDFGAIAYIPQQYSVDRNFPGTVEEILSLQKGENPASVASSLDIKPYLRKKFSELSGGQQQRVLIALALLRKPRLLVCDEPEAGVDAKGQHKFYALLRRLNESGITIIVVSHDIGVVEKNVRRVLCINRSVCYFGKSTDTRTLLRKAYGEAFGHVHHH